jgi:hypothetical protein
MCVHIKGTIPSDCALQNNGAASILLLSKQLYLMGIARYSRVHRANNIFYTVETPVLECFIEWEGDHTLFGLEKSGNGLFLSHL